MKKENKNLVIGILAHVDAGKTTLAEAILYLTGSIRKLGRVDHRDAFLDTYEMERARGITIFSKQARFTLGDKKITLLDTPGHVDFSAEMERTLQVLDAAVLVISGADGIQGHDLTLWNLLSHYHIPVFLFVNKMDQEGTDRENILHELRERFDERCMDFGAEEEAFFEELAMCEEELLEQYLETGKVEVREIRRLIQERSVFPCYFGSALKLTGVEEFLKGLECFAQCPVYPEEFGAKVFKIGRDAQGNRLTYMKITGGSLKVKEVLLKEEGQEPEKADQIRLYSGEGFSMVKEVEAGDVCAVTGPVHTFSGQGLGMESEALAPMLEPVLTYGLILPEGCDVHGFYRKLQQLEEEDPKLHLVWEEHTGQICVQVMGKVQAEILKHLILERFQLDVEFGTGSIVYKETITKTAEGVGHFEPLRHYAEVHLLLEPTARGSGLTFETDCSEDLLDRNWQRLILTHLYEKKHKGVLTGSQITDIKITLMAGKAHLKHTEGGDFRQATYRAVRQGLMSTESILLEPVYAFRLEVPNEYLGRAMSDITRMHGSFAPPQMKEGGTVLEGSAPVSEMGEYQTQVAAYTKGMGKLFCTLKGYEPCHDQEKVIEEIGYDRDGDLDNPSGSVFCAHGAGFVVPWDQVPEYMHLESILKEKEPEPMPEADVRTVPDNRGAVTTGWQDKELEEIFNRTYASGKEGRSGWGRSRFPGGYERTRPDSMAENRSRRSEPVKEYLLVDGYNIIFAWEDLRELSKVNMESARGKLMDLLCNYQGYKKNTVILVFDAYKVDGGVGESIAYHNIHVIYTKEAETADQYIEKTVHEIGKKYHVTVATSDAMEQRIIWGAGASRLSAEGLKEELASTSEEIRKEWLSKTTVSGNKLFHALPEELADLIEDVRLGKKELKNEK